MILAFHPTLPEMPGEEQPVPPEWRRYISPWAKSIFRRNDFGSTLLQELLTDDFAIYIWRLDVNSAIRLYPLAEKPTIALQFTLEGNISWMFKGFGEKFLVKGNQEMFYVPIGYNEAWFEPGIYESLHIELKPQYLEELKGGRAEIKELVFRLQSSSSRSLPMAVAGINYLTGAVLQNIRTCDRNDPFFQLQMHIYILELLCEYVSAISKSEAEGKMPNISRKDLLIRIRNYILLAPDIRKHTAKHLAKHFGISETLLRRSFISYFGISISEYVRSQALARSRHLLATTVRTIEDIGEEVGYAWRQAFEVAFRKQYQYSPSGLRDVLKS